MTDYFRHTVRRRRTIKKKQLGGTSVHTYQKCKSSVYKVPTKEDNCQCNLRSILLYANFLVVIDRGGGSADSTIIPSIHEYVTKAIIKGHMDTNTADTIRILVKFGTEHAIDCLKFVWEGFGRAIDRTMMFRKNMQITANNKTMQAWCILNGEEVFAELPIKDVVQKFTDWYLNGDIRTEFRSLFKKN
jgi:hypothetical protein